MIYLGNNKIDKLNYGGYDIKEAYYGDTLVYSSGDNTIIIIPDPVLKTALYNLITTHKIPGEITQSEADTLTSLPANFLYNKTTLTSLEGLKYFNNITSIGASAFSGCSNLVTFDFPPNCTTIGNGTFMNCIKLVEADVSSVLIISADGFYNCTALTKIILGPANVRLNTTSFYNCQKLADINFEGVTYIETRAFLTCIGLKTLTFNQATLIKEAFYNCNQVNKIYLNNITNVNTFDSNAFWTVNASCTITAQGNQQTKTFYRANGAVIPLTWV
jgi:hypothetical protein